MKRSKKYKAAAAKVDGSKLYSPLEAMTLAKETSTTKYDASVEVAMLLGVDPKKADQALRGTVSLPHGIGKAVRVLVIAKPPKDEEAKAAGADHAGFQDYLDKIKGGWADVDVIIATPDVMGELGKLGKILGPRGLMPNPKSGTVTNEIGKTVKEVKAGKIEFRVDKAGILHATIGKADFEKQKLVENVHAFLNTVIRLKPATAKGQYIKSIAISSTMSPGVHIDKNSVAAH